MKLESNFRTKLFKINLNHFLFYFFGANFERNSKLHYWKESDTVRSKMALGH